MTLVDRLLAFVTQKMTSVDKDFRFMATNDLMTELQNDSIKLDDDSERKVVVTTKRPLCESSAVANVVSGCFRLSRRCSSCSKTRMEKSRTWLSNGNVFSCGVRFLHTGQLCDCSANFLASDLWSSKSKSSKWSSSSTHCAPTCCPTKNSSKTFQASASRPSLVSCPSHRPK